MTDQTKESVTLPELLTQAVDARLADLNVCLPGIVESYDRDTQMAKVQPALKRKYVDGKIVDLPIINKVPIIFPKSKNKFIHHDLEKGDYVTLIFSQRSLDSWKEKGGLVSPNDPRRFNLSDAYGIPGGSPRPEAFSPNGGVGSLELANGTSFLTLEQDGIVKVKTSSGLIEIRPNGELEFSNDVMTFKLNNAGKVKIQNAGEELISLLSDLLTEIIGAQTITMLGLQPLVGFTQTFPVLKTKIDTFKE